MNFPVLEISEEVNHVIQSSVPGFFQETSRHPSADVHLASVSALHPFYGRMVFLKAENFNAFHSAKLSSSDPTQITVH